MAAILSINNVQIQNLGFSRCFFLITVKCPLKLIRFFLFISKNELKKFEYIYLAISSLRYRKIKYLSCIYIWLCREHFFFKRVQDFNF